MENLEYTAALAELSEQRKVRVFEYLKNRERDIRKDAFAGVLQARKVLEYRQRYTHAPTASNLELLDTAVALYIVDWLRRDGINQRQRADRRRNSWWMRLLKFIIRKG